MTSSLAGKRLAIWVTYNGIEKELETQDSAAVKSLLVHAVVAFGIKENQHLLSLFDANGIELRDNQSVSEAGIISHDRLLLRPSEVKGGLR